MAFKVNENGHYRGLHMAVIDSLTAEVMLARVYDTHVSSVKIEEDFLIFEKFSVNIIIVAVC